MDRTVQCHKHISDGPISTKLQTTHKAVAIDQIVQYHRHIRLYQLIGLAQGQTCLSTQKTDYR